jgi:hypothetical protein
VQLVSRTKDAFRYIKLRVNRSLSPETLKSFSLCWSNFKVNFGEYITVFRAVKIGYLTLNGSWALSSRAKNTDFLQD